MADRPKLFISYSRSNSAFAERLYKTLTAVGFPVWWDQEAMEARGDTFLDAIQRGVNGADRLLLLVSEEAMKSVNVGFEWKHALQYCKVINPLLLEGDFKDLLPPELSLLHTFDFRKPDDYDAEIEKLLHELEAEPIAMGKLYGVPTLPSWYIPREATHELIRKVREDSVAPVVITAKNQTVAVQGMGGIGKSTLAAAVAHDCEVLRSYPDGVFWVELGKKPDVAIRQGDIGQAFGESREEYADEKRGKANLDKLLSDKQVLLILDDVWDEAHANAFKVSGARCRILITTRSGRLVTQLGAVQQKLDTLSEAEGLALLRERLTKAPTAAQEAALKAIIKLLDGHTLSVNLARAHLEERGIENAPNLLERLQKRLGGDNPFKDLELGENKNGNVEITLAESYETLGGFREDEVTLKKRADLQRRFRALGIFALGSNFSAAAAGAIWDDEDSDETDDILNDLVRAALLEVEERAAKTDTDVEEMVEKRYSQHNLLWAYARALQKRAGEADDLFKRYADFYTNIAEQFDELPPEKWGVLDDDLSNIHAVGDELVKRTDIGQKGDLNRALAFALNITNYLFRRREVRRREWLEMGMNTARTLQKHGGHDKERYQRREGLFLNALGAMWNALGEKRKALEYYEQALPLRQAVEDRGGEATTLNNMGAAWYELGEPRKALTYYEQALSLDRVMGDLGGEATTLSNIGAVWSALGEKRKALEFYEQAMQLHRAMEDRGGEAAALNNIGLVRFGLGEKQNALAHYEQAMQLIRMVGDRAGEAATLNNIGGVWGVLGEPEKALTHYEQALQLVRMVGDRAGEAMTLSNIGTVYRTLGEPRKALVCYEQVLQLVRVMGNQADEIVMFHNMGEVWETLGERRKALACYEQVLPLVRGVGDQGSEAATLNNIGEVWRTLGEPRKALAYYEQALRLVRVVGNQGGETTILRNMGIIYAALGDLDQAIAYVSQYVELDEQLEHPGLENDRAYLQRLIAIRDGNPNPPPQAGEGVEDKQAHAMAVIVKIYREQGEDGLRERLKQSGMEDAVIEQVVAAIKGINQAQ